MTVEPTTLPALRRLSAVDDLTGVVALMAAYIAEIRRNLLEGHGLRFEDATPDDPDRIVDIAGLLEPPQCLYLAEVDGRPAGTCGLKQITPEVAEIKRMYVDPLQRGRGVGRALIERVIDDARAAGYRTLQLETAIWMTEAHALYGRCGFVDAPPFPDPEFGCVPGCEHLARYMTLSLNEV
ncbi:MAG TPA: GNAT family N-acetyltransferase [Acidimicrobiia bacterium]|nr:GNAT family N-acetyltransferase [Acidimicrobiia bacterium]